MHGEYKVPGGKLVVVDLDIQNNQLCNVEVSGDFFLFPEETLWDIAEVLNGAPADADEGAITDWVQRATEGAEMIGLTAEGVAVAVRRAVGAAI